MGDGRATIADFERKFAEIRCESERAIAQLDAAAIRRSLDGDVNSVAIIMKHVGGNLRRTVHIRGEPHSVALALARAVAHLGYHQGSDHAHRAHAGGPSSWKTISIPRGGTSAHHAALGFDPHK